MEKLFKIGSLYGSYFTCRDLAAGRIPPECGELEIPGLPEFLNAEPDDMGQLVNPETGETMSWGDLDRAKVKEIAE